MYAELEIFARSALGSGRIVTDQSWETGDARVLRVRTAGTLLRRPHGGNRSVPFPDDWLAMQVGADRSVSADGVDPADRAAVRGLLRDLSGVPAPALVPCHHDYSPRNWLTTGDGTVGVIDFEWAGPDVWVADLGRLAFGWWRDRPDLLGAFLDGYGRRPDEAGLAMLRAGYAVACLRLVGWADQHGDAAFAAHARDTLHELAGGRGEVAWD